MMYYKLSGHVFMQFTIVIHLVRADLHPIWWYMIYQHYTVTSSFVGWLLHEYLDLYAILVIIYHL
jgi:hypothetical protein